MSLSVSIVCESLHTEWTQESCEYCCIPKSILILGLLKRKAVEDKGSDVNYDFENNKVFEHVLTTMIKHEMGGEFTAPQIVQTAD